MAGKSKKRNRNKNRKVQEMGLNKCSVVEDVVEEDIAVETKENEDDQAPTSPTSVTTTVALPTVTLPTVKNEPAKKCDPSLPAPLQQIMGKLTTKQQVLAKLLCSPLLGQEHLFHQGSVIKCIRQLEALNDACPGGLTAFLLNADSKTKENTVPPHAIPTIAMEEKDLAAVGFVYCAEEGKIEPDLKSIIEKVLNVQPTDMKLSLSILSCNKPAINTLERNNYFGLQKSQVTVVELHHRERPVLDDNLKIQWNGFKIVTEKVDNMEWFLSARKEWDGIQWIAFLDENNSLEGELSLNAYRFDTHTPCKLIVNGVASIVEENGDGEHVGNVVNDVIKPFEKEMEKGVDVVGDVRKADDGENKRCEVQNVPKAADRGREQGLEAIDVAPKLTVQAPVEEIKPVEVVEIVIENQILDLSNPHPSDRVEKAADECNCVIL